MIGSCVLAAVACAGFGTTKYGEKAKLYTLTGKGGLRMEVTDYGGRVNRLWVPDASGKLADVTIGFDSPAGWETTDSYFGAIIGRFGNRIADGTFVQDGNTYALAKTTPTTTPVCTVVRAAGTATSGRPRRSRRAMTSASSSPVRLRMARRASPAR